MKHGKRTIHLVARPLIWAWCRLLAWGLRTLKYRSRTISRHANSRIRACCEISDTTRTGIFQVQALDRVDLACRSTSMSLDMAQSVVWAIPCQLRSLPSLDFVLSTWYS